MEVYHELTAEWKSEKLDVTSLFAKVPISVIARAEMEKYGKEPDMVTLQVFESTVPGQAGELSCKACIASIA